jgi:hypothetical protein
MSERECVAMAKEGEVTRWSSDSEGDEVPIKQIIKTKTDKVELVIPEGQQAVGAGIARAFGKDMGVFKGQVRHVQAVRRGHIYHVQYEDGESEDFDVLIVDEYKYVYELRHESRKRTRWSHGG